MKCITTAALLSVLSLTAAFAPNAGRQIIITGRSSLSLNAAAKSASKPFSSIPNPFKKLPWNVEKEKAAAARRLRQEGAVLYRQLGVAEDATYEEIVIATDALIAKADGDMKKKVKAEITKDKILQLRLQQRVAGQIAESSQARVERTIMADAEELARKRSGTVRIPKWIPRGIVKPSTDEVEQRNNILIFGGLLFAALVSPESSDPLKFVGTCLFIFKTMSRGMPKYSRSQPPPPNATKHYLPAFLSSFLFYMLTNGFSKLVMYQFFNPEIPSQLVLIKQLQFLIICPVYWWISNNIQFYKGPSVAAMEED